MENTMEPVDLNTQILISIRDELKGLNGKYTFPNGELAYVSKLYFGRIKEARGIT